MDHRVREDGLELALEGQGLGRDQPCVETPRAGRGDHRRRRIHTDHTGTARGDLCGQDSIAAAEVENAFTRARIQDVQEICSERGDECRVPRVGIGAPGIARVFLRVGHGAVTTDCLTRRTRSSNDRGGGPCLPKQMNTRFG
jgi:hypothetical protein